MSVEADRAQFRNLSARFNGAEFEQLKERLDLAQLEQTISALYQTLPKPKAMDAEATMRRMFERAKRWDK